MVIQVEVVLRWRVGVALADDCGILPALFVLAAVVLGRLLLEAAEGVAVGLAVDLRPVVVFLAVAFLAAMPVFMASPATSFNAAAAMP